MARSPILQAPPTGNKRKRRKGPADAMRQRRRLAAAQRPIVLISSAVRRPPLPLPRIATSLQRYGNTETVSLGMLVVRHARCALVIPLHHFPHRQFRERRPLPLGESRQLCDWEPNRRCPMSFPPLLPCTWSDHVENIKQLGRTQRRATSVRPNHDRALRCVAHVLASALDRRDHHRRR